MKIDTKEKWILAAYELFAYEGPKGLKIEVIAKKVGISKSSFYHHFADMEIFIDILLDYHLERARIVASQESKCQCIDPELINVLIEYKTDILFNRQLRINRVHLNYNQCFEKSNKLAENAIIEIWAKDLGLKHKSRLVEILFALVLENFYLQVTEDTLNYDWLSSYFSNLRELAKEFNNL